MGKFFPIENADFCESSTKTYFQFKSRLSIFHRKRTNVRKNLESNSKTCYNDITQARGKPKKRNKRREVRKDDASYATHNKRKDG